MPVRIQNAYLSAAIHPVGAELQSLCVKHSGHEVIWQRDPEIWAGSAPILFPIVGRLRGGRYTLNGKTYEMSPHGVVRKREWDVASTGETFVEFSITDDDASRQSFPFHWALRARFELEDLSLSVRYQVENTDSRVLPFSFGSHPAFNLDFGSDQLSDYALKTDIPDEPWRRHKIIDGLLSRDTHELPWQGSELPMSETMFDEDALIFVDVGCKELSIIHNTDPRCVIFDTGGAPDLGIWAKPAAPYVCIEPWYGYDDPEDHNQRFEDKPGIRTLSSGEVFETSYTIGLNDAWLSPVD